MVDLDDDDQQPDPAAAAAGLHKWENAYKRSWEVLEVCACVCTVLPASWDSTHFKQNDESIAGVVASLAREKLRRRRALLNKDGSALPVHRGIIRHVYVVVDMSEGMTGQADSLPPSRVECVLANLETFVQEFLLVNPLGSIGLILTRDGGAEKLTEMTGTYNVIMNETHLKEVLSSHVSPPPIESDQSTALAKIEMGFPSSKTFDAFALFINEARSLGTNAHDKNRDCVIKFSINDLALASSAGLSGAVTWDVVCSSGCDLTRGYQQHATAVLHQVPRWLGSSSSALHSALQFLLMAAMNSDQGRPSLDVQHEELRALQDELAKLSALLADVQALPIPRSSLSAINPPPGTASSKISSPTPVAGVVGTATASDSQSSISSDSAAPNSDWTVEMVAEWVRQKGASEDIVKSFVEQEVDGTVLLSLSADDLKNELGVVSFGLRRKLIMAIEKVRAF
ncbi:transcription initiation factor TFIIH subunit [Entophlyctis luteolus]|nr:transcription initiation factor TFIIH subunit [Entophlyctis luteolus]